MKKSFIILFFVSFFCSVFSQELMHGKSYNNVVIPRKLTVCFELIFIHRDKPYNSERFDECYELFGDFMDKIREKSLEQNLPIHRNVTHLTVTGTITWSTFWFMRDSLPNLTYLNLSQARIVPSVRERHTDKRRFLFRTRYVLRYPSGFDGKNRIPQDAFFTFFGIGGNWRSHRNLQRVILPETLYAIGRNAFRETPIDSIAIPHGVRQIRDGAFMNCANLRYISLPDGLEEIGEQAFSGSGLTRIEIPKSVRRIGHDLFGLFRSSSNLREISVYWQDPASVEILESNAFPLCWSEIFSEEGLERFLRDIGIRDVKLIVPRGTREKYLTLEPWRFFQIVEREQE